MSECLVPGQPASEKLPQLVYDQQLAEQAQRWANNCTINHDKPSDRKHPKWKYVGQNWAADHSYESSFNAWFPWRVTVTCNYGPNGNLRTNIIPEQVLMRISFLLIISLLSGSPELRNSENSIGNKISLIGLKKRVFE
ncbi:unnamed protein product [Fasciola hepatica]|uniref:SCP domain-containing protein n=1 Tax=Fasciola hepatica TaxID=6192 RepID=A0ABC9HIN7_FASHE